MLVDVCMHLVIDAAVGVLRFATLQCFAGMCAHPGHRWRLWAINVVAVVCAAFATVILVG